MGHKIAPGRKPHPKIAVYRNLRSRIRMQQHQYSQHKVLTLETTGMKHMKTAAATTSKGPAVHQGGTPLGADCASQISDFFPR